jgi:hypothetical protein
VRTIRRESRDVESFAQGLSQRLDGQQARVAAQAYQADPLVRLVLGPSKR